MNDQTPGQPATEHLDVGDGARVRPARDKPARRGRKGLLIGGGVAAVALAGGGAWAWTAFFAQGSQPAEALPDSTLAYVSVDLDPPGQQKVEAIKTLRKFPGFRDNVGLDTDDDVRKEVFASLQDEGLCEDVDYDDDVEPWLGDRAAFALVDQGKDQPVPVVVVQIKDQGDAEVGLEKLTACAADASGSGSVSGSGDENDLGGYAFTGDWVVLAETEGIAQDVVDAAGDGSLSDDGDYTKWTEAAGDAGIVTMYAAPEAGEALLQLSGIGGLSSSSGYAEESSTATTMAPAALAPVDEETDSPQPSEDPNAVVPGTRPSNSPTESPSDDPTASSTEQPSDVPSELPGDLPSEPDEMPTQLDDPPFEDNPSDDEMPDEMRKMLEDFPGGAMVIRFDDGDLELEMATGSLDSSITEAFDTDRGGDLVGSLPDSTAVAYGLGFSDGWLGALIDEFGPMIEDSTGESVDQALADFEQEFGISVPEDIEALTGESVAVALDAEFDPDAVESSPEELPAGFVVRGDPDEIQPVLEKIRANLPAEEQATMVWRADGDRVLVGTSDAYLDQLADGGDLGSTDAYESVLPDSDKAASVFFVNFDAGGGDGWLADLVGQFDSQEASDNVEPLQAFGISSWVDDDEAHALMRLTTEE